jgi:hypothetical protein
LNDSYRGELCFLSRAANASQGKPGYHMEHIYEMTTGTLIQHSIDFSNEEILVSLTRQKRLTATRRWHGLCLKQRAEKISNVVSSGMRLVGRPLLISSASA